MSGIRYIWTVDNSHFWPRSLGGISGPNLAVAKPSAEHLARIIVSISESRQKPKTATAKLGVSHDVDFWLGLEPAWRRSPNFLKLTAGVSGTPKWCKMEIWWVYSFKIWDVAIFGIFGVDFRGVDVRFNWKNDGILVSRDSLRHDTQQKRPLLG